MAGLKASGGKKNRKYGRNKKFCEKYRLENRREKNLKRRLLARVRRNSKDIGAVDRLKELGVVL